MTSIGFAYKYKNEWLRFLSLSFRIKWLLVTVKSASCVSHMSTSYEKQFSQKWTGATIAELIFITDIQRSGSEPIKHYDKKRHISRYFEDSSLDTTTKSYYVFMMISFSSLWFDIISFNSCNKKWYLSYSKAYGF